MSKHSKKTSSWLKEKPLGKGLRQAYQDTMNEPVPQKLQDLVQQLKQKEMRSLR